MTSKEAALPYSHEQTVIGHPWRPPLFMNEGVKEEDGVEPILLTYHSKTGFIKRYVDWIAETLNCLIIPYKTI